MALTTPTLREIQTQIVSDLEAEFGQSIPIFAKAVWRILGLVFAGAWIILFKFGTDAFKQRFVQTANEKFLELLGELIKIIRQAATIWDGEGEVVSTATTGVLDPGTQLVNNNTGVVYTTKEAVILSAGTLTLKLVSTQGGAIGDLIVGDILNFVSPVPGLAETATISLVNVVGEDKEDLEVYRQRVLDGYQKKPQGGALADYEQWAEEAPNVINAYPYAAANPGQVNVYTEVDNQTDGIPTSTQLTATLAFINFDPVTGRATRRPVTAEVFSLAISRRTFDSEVVALSPDESETRALIDAAIIELLTQKEPFIQGLTITRNDTISQAEITSIAQTVAASQGATISGVNVRESAVLIDLEVLGEGEKAKSGVITYVT